MYNLDKTLELLGKRRFQTIGISGMHESHVRNWEIVVDARLVRMGSFSIYKIKKRRKYALIGREYNIFTEILRASNTEG